MDNVFNGVLVQCAQACLSLALNVLAPHKLGLRAVVWMNIEVTVSLWNFLVRFKVGMLDFDQWWLLNPSLAKLESNAAVFTFYFQV